MSRVELDFESRLAAPPEKIWAQVSTMSGVNRELMPLLRMTYPPQAQSLEAAGNPVGDKLFYSWLLAGGLLPIDRHHLGIERIYPGAGFDERSSSWTQRLWIHRRRVLPLAGGARLTDELRFEPRIGFMAPVLRRFITLIFQHRHRVLRCDFGVLGA